MKRIYIAKGSNDLIFPNSPFQAERETRLSRKTYLAFARWLRKNVCEEDLKPEIVEGRTFFNRYKHDLRADRVEVLRLIKATKPEDLYRTLGFFKKQASCCIPKWAQDALYEIPLYYREDFYQLLRIHGLSEEEAAMFLEIAEDGSYKTYCRCHPRKEQLAAVSEDLHSAAKLLDGLPSRNWIRLLFKDEYPRFREEFDQRTGHTTREASKKGECECVKMSSEITDEELRSYYDISIRTVRYGAYSSTRYMASRILRLENCSTVVFDRSLSGDKLAEELKNHYDGRYLIEKCLKGPWTRRPGDVQIRYDADSLGIIFPDPDRDKVLLAVLRIMDDHEMEEAIIYEAASGKTPAALVFIDRKLCECPVCGLKTLYRRGDWDICPECGWEDEGEGWFGLDENGDSMANGCNIEDYRKAWQEKKQASSLDKTAPDIGLIHEQLLRQIQSRVQEGK